MRGLGLIFTPVLVRCFLVSLSLSGHMTSMHFLQLLMEPSNSPVGSCKSSVATIYHERTMVASILKIGISQNAMQCMVIVWLVFHNQVT